jgi:hypothetical protein
MNTVHETNLVIILNKVKTDPWSLLIFQTLLWSFRRWAIHYLMSSEASDTMKDYVWDSHLDLVRQFAPVELKDFGIIWLNPSNIGSRIDNLEELNTYFYSIVDALDIAIQTDNEEEQSALASFLDDRLTEIIDVWLDGQSDFRIYPTANQSPDSFSPARVFEIMRLILKAPEPEPEPEPEPVPVAEPLPVPEPVPDTVTGAMNKKKMTRKSHGHGVPKTRKRKPAHI